MVGEEKNNRVNKIKVILILISLLSFSLASWQMTRKLEILIGLEEDLSFHFRLADNDVVGWNKGELIWRLQVSNILEPPLKDKHSGGEELILRDIYRGYFYRQDEILFTFTVEEAHYNTRTGDLVLYDCRMESPLGDWLVTDKMYYDKKRNDLRAPGPVVGNMAGTDFKADEMRVYFDDEEINMFNIRMVHSLKKK
ncbi:MAG: hypothetical protein GX801_12170 [Fibrobacter sp.]|nr:hypothetical protein [Fibrobacter sp.]